MKPPQEIWDRSVFTRLGEGYFTAERVWRVYDTTDGIPQIGDPHPLFEGLKAKKPEPLFDPSWLGQIIPQPSMMVVRYATIDVNYPIDAALRSRGL